MSHDVFHLPHFIDYATVHEEGTPRAFYARKGDVEFLAPVLIRELPEHMGGDHQWFDTSTTYGFPAPLISDPNDALLVKQFLQAFRDASKEHGIVTAFFRMNPVLDFPLSALETCGTVVKHGKVVIIDLHESDEEFESNMRKDHARGIRKLKERGFVAHMDEWSHFEEFLDIYFMTMERVSASSFYFFDREYFAGLREAMKDHLHLCTVTAPDGVVADGGLIFEANGIIQTHLGGTHTDFRKFGPARLKISYVRDWSKEFGCHTFNLGGGVGGNDSDSLFEFKRGFSKTYTDFHTFRMIIDDEKYTDLMRRWQDHTGSTPSEDNDFFPPYRLRS